MTFPARLTELIEATQKTPSYGTFKALRMFMSDHAEAIRDLVAAVENLNSGISLTRNEDKEKMWKLTVALSKLEES